MVDLEDMLRAEVIRRSEEEYEPSADLPDRIEARALQVRRERQRLAAGAMVAGVAAVVLAVVLLPLSDPGGDDVQIGDEPRESSTTTSEATTSSTTIPSTTDPSTTAVTPSTTAPSQQTTTTTVQPAAPSGPLVGPDTPLSRSGIGPITAGMTLREAEAAAGVTLTPYDPSTGGSCLSGTIDGTGVQFLAERAGSDVDDSVVRSVSRTVEGSTEQGVSIGDPPSAVTETYGQPTRIEPEWDGPGSQLLVFESGGYAYSFLTNTTEVAVIDSGDRAWIGIGAPNGCT